MTVYFADETLALHVGDASDVLAGMDAGSVDCVVTSPPYYNLRDYEGNPDQLGLEETPAEYVARLVEVFIEVHRVLDPHGTLWLNLGDSYAYPPGSSGRQGNGQRKGRTFTAEGLRGTRALPPKNLIGIPWRTAFALQDAGWYLRNAIVWHKVNAKPESVLDRLSSRNEMVFLLTKSRKYWFDLDAIRIEHTSEPARRLAGTQPGGLSRKGKDSRLGVGDRSGGATVGDHAAASHPLGRNPGDVWAMPVAKFPGAHFAVFPLALPNRCIRAGCRPGGTVLDPFSGAGTTALAAQQLGHSAIGIDINATYHDIALQRMADAPLPLLDGEAS
jgi:site-specific DNA-methyltransferase (cytosine-N4-specific)